MRKKYYVILVILVMLGTICITGCGGPAIAKNGDTVKVHYTGKLADGTVFDTSVGSEPLPLQILAFLNGNVATDHIPFS